MPLDMNYIGQLPTKEREQYKTELLMKLREKEEELNDVMYKLKMWMKDSKIHPDDLKALLEYRNDTKKEIDHILYDLQQIKKVIHIDEWNDVDDDFSSESPRDLIGGSLTAGAGVITLRLPKIEKDKRIPTYKEIHDKKRKDGTRPRKKE